MIKQFEALIKAGEIYCIDQMNLQSRSERTEPIPEVYRKGSSGMWLMNDEKLRGKVWLHQAKAMTIAAEGRNFVICTGTASGKSLVFQSAALRILDEDPEAVVMVFYPLKALSGDQILSWRRAAKMAGFRSQVAAVLGLCRQLGLPQLLHRTASRVRDLALAAMIARMLSPASKLATARQLSPDSAAFSLGAKLGLGGVKGNEVMNMLDWLLTRQPWIERGLSRRYLQQGTMVLYDMTSSYLKGSSCPLARFGYNRDRKRGKKPIAIGMLCNAEGCPISVQVFDGNTTDPGTVAAQISQLKKCFSVQRIALVRDRGMLTTARIRETVSPEGLDWISALKTTDLRRLLKPLPDGGSAPLRPESLAADQVAEIVSPDFPGERLMVCLNPRLAEERARKREALLVDTEEILQGIADRVNRTGSKWRGRYNRCDCHNDVSIDNWSKTGDRNLPPEMNEGVFITFSVTGSGSTQHRSLFDLSKRRRLSDDRWGAAHSSFY